ncbi:MAG TPA: deoxyribonuclease IV [Gemmatimonadales bacterium]|jgi:deoxyribonuclease-4|nr:deoxyribonuclease IV [Gemmatimonadales bacterium]
MRKTSGTQPRQEKKAQGADTPRELLGAHVSTAGGPATAPGRGAAIGATAIQIFTKTPNMWREPVVTSETAAAFLAARDADPVASVVSHDSYLINLASPDPTLRARSIAAFTGELARCEALELDGVVSHPGNFIDDHDAGLARNAAGIAEALRAVPGRVNIFLECTAGSGTVLGRTFEELRDLRNLIPEDLRERVAFCADTCHLYSAGYDLVGDYDGVWRQWDAVIGLSLLKCLHLNDSKTPFSSRRDRHELLGEGSLGPEPFRRIINDARFAGIPKVLETPKGDDDEVSNDRRMLAMLREMRAAL